MAPKGLSRSQSALEGLSLLLGQSVGDFYQEVGPELVSAWDVALEPKLLAVLQEHLGSILSLLRSTAAAAVQTAGSRFVAQCCGSQALGAVLRQLGAGEILARAVRAHPKDRQVQSHAQWAIFRLQGWEELLALLRDPELGGSSDVVRAALWSLSHAGEKWLVPGPTGPSSTTRRELVELTLLALTRFGADSEVAAYGLGVISNVLVSRTSDGWSGQGLAAVPHVLRTLQQHFQEVQVLSNGTRALANLVGGNASVVQLLQQHWKEVEPLLNAALQSSSNAEVLGNICKIYASLSGATQLVQMLHSSCLQRNEQRTAVLWTLGRHAEDFDAALLVTSGTVGRICQIAAQEQAAAPACVSALGRTVEVLVEEVSRGTCQGEEDALNLAVEEGLSMINQRLQVEISSSKPNVEVYAEALLALRNVSRRCPQLATRIAASEAVLRAVNLALERDYFSLNFASLSQLLGAVSFFAGLPRLQALLEKYPDAPVFHEAACGVLIDDAEHQDGSSAPGTVLAAASSLAFYATWVLRDLVQQAPRPEPLAANAVKLQGYVLGHAARAHRQPETEVPSGPLLVADGVRSLLQAMRDNRHSAWVASEVCCALVHIAATDRDALAEPLLASGAGQELLALMERFPEDQQVLSDAAVAVGVLAGAHRVTELMRSAPSMFSVQLAGCQAHVQLCRLGYHSTDPAAREAAVAVVEGARQALPHSPWLEAQVELARGLLQSGQCAATDMGTGG